MGRHNLGLYIVFAFLLDHLHLGKLNLGFLVLHAPLEIVQVSYAPLDLVLGLSASSLDFGFLIVDRTS